MNNPNNLKIGDKILVEQAWEDESGTYHDEEAIILEIEEDGNLTLDWNLASKTIGEFLDSTDGYYAKDFKKIN